MQGPQNVKKLVGLGNCNGPMNTLYKVNRYKGDLSSSMIHISFVYANRDILQFMIGICLELSLGHLRTFGLYTVLSKGSFENYVDKMRWVVGQKMLLFVNV